MRTAPRYFGGAPNIFEEAPPAFTSFSTASAKSCFASWISSSFSAATFRATRSRGGGVCRLQDFSICIRSSANSWTTFISLSSHAKANQALYCKWREMANGRANAQRRKSQGKRLTEPPNQERLIRLISLIQKNHGNIWEHMGTC